MYPAICSCFPHILKNGLFILFRTIIFKNDCPKDENMRYPLEYNRTEMNFIDKLDDVKYAGY